MKNSMFLLCLVALLFTVTVSAQSSWNYTIFNEITNSTGVLFRLEFGIRKSGYDGYVRWRITNYTKNVTVYDVSIADKKYTLSDGRIVSALGENIASTLGPGESKTNIEPDAVNTAEHGGFSRKANPAGLKSVSMKQPYVQFAVEKNGKRYGWDMDPLSVKASEEAKLQRERAEEQARLDKQKQLEQEEIKKEEAKQKKLEEEAKLQQLEEIRKKAVEDGERKKQEEEKKKKEEEERKIKAEEERLKRLREEEERRRREEELRRQRLLEFRANMSQLQQLALNAVRTQSQETLDRQRESLAEFKGKLFGKSITYSNPILDEGSQLIKTTLDQKITETVIDDDNFNGDLAEPIFSLPNAWKSLKEKDILGFFQGLGFTKPLNYWQNRGLETVDQVGNDLVKDYSSLMDRLFIESNDLDSDQADVMVDDVFNKVKKNLLNIIPGLGDLWHSINK